MYVSVICIHRVYISSDVDGVFISEFMKLLFHENAKRYINYATEYMCYT
jgi:nitrous oxidase accessory protein NosD